MSDIFYIASNAPLTERLNPHEKLLSVNEALNLGMKDIPDFMLEECFDKDKPKVLLYSDRAITINADGTIEDGDFDDDFSIWLTEKDCGMKTEKEFCGILEWTKYTSGRAKEVIRYLEEQLINTSEIELWHIWIEEGVFHRLNKKVISIKDLTPEDIEALDKKEVCMEPMTDYCYCIVR